MHTRLTESRRSSVHFVDILSFGALSISLEVKQFTIKGKNNVGTKWNEIKTKQLTI